MVIQLSKNVTLIRSRAWFGRIRWQAHICEGDGDRWEWVAMTDALTTDKMHIHLIAAGFPQSDIALFIEAINNPDVTPFNPKLNNQPKKGRVRLGKPQNDMALSKEPRGIFNAEHQMQ